jgi:ADP-ribose pyrophosphatase YjhB (NUDIX family)
MAFVLCRNPEATILLGQSPYQNMWMPPQEGVNLHETFQQALLRCLEVECGLDLPTGDKDLARKFHLRSIRYMGEVPLPEERVGERPVADDALDTWLEPITLRRKAYWMATMLLANQSDISPRPDGKEVIDLKWFPLTDARRIIAETNHANKASLLLRSLDACEKDLRGAARVS